MKGGKSSCTKREVHGGRIILKIAAARRRDRGRGEVEGTKPPDLVCRRAPSHQDSKGRTTSVEGMGQRSVKRRKEKV